MQNSVDLLHDILNGAIKSIFFAFVINLIAIYEGAICKPTADGVSRAVTNTVVISALSVLAVDFILTSFMFTGA
jgi:phospholipid/cholesterol/gamma-HCH transport system permease protein